MNAYRWILGLGVLTSIRCSGTETDNPVEPASSPHLIEFHDTGCKGPPGSAATPDGGTTTESYGTSRQALSMPGDTDSLNCVEWEIDAEGALSLRFANFSKGCGAQFGGDVVAIGPGTLELLVVNEECMFAACGSCLYDWTFTVDGVAPDQDLSVTLSSADCPDASASETEVTLALPIATEPSGARCRYVTQFSLALSAFAGTRNAPCAGAVDCPDPSVPCRCLDGLVCTELLDVGHRCLEPCSQDTDCTMAGAVGCQDGLCKIAATF